MEQHSAVLCCFIQRCSWRHILFRTRTIEIMKQFPEMWIPCSKQEYPEVKQLLEGMGCTEFDSYEIHSCKGVETYRDGDFQVVSCFSPNSFPTVTLPELREMARVVLREGTYSSPKPTVIPAGEDIEQLKTELHNAKADLETFQFVAKDYSDSLTKLRDLVSLMRDAQIKDSSEKGYLEAEVDAYLWKLNNPF